MKGFFKFLYPFLDPDLPCVLGLYSLSFISDLEIHNTYSFVPCIRAYLTSPAASVYLYWTTSGADDTIVKAQIHDSP